MCRNWSPWLAGVCVALAGCRPPSVEHALAERPYFSTLPMGVRATVPVPAASPVTPAKAELGRRLFFDKRLSRDGSVSCATCHVPTRAFTDGRAVSVGVDGAVGRRNAPTLLNRAYGSLQFWDGRSRTLDEQALVPMESPVELGNTHAEIVRRLRDDRSYRRAFTAAFGSDDITVERVAAAIATFERTLVSGNTPFDRFVVLNDSTALSPPARRGLELFRGRAQCITCHEGALLTDEKFHNTGVAWRDGVFSDSGRYAVTGRAMDLGAFRTPTLREVARTAPYMHDGSMATLDEVIGFYADGGRANPNLDPAIRVIELTADERADLVAFLVSLTGQSGAATRR